MFVSDKRIYNGYQITTKVVMVVHLLKMIYAGVQTQTHDGLQNKHTKSN